MSKEKEMYASLLKTLSFLNDIGAGDPFLDDTMDKTSLSMTPAKMISQHIKSEISAPAPTTTNSKSKAGQKQPKFPQTPSQIDQNINFTEPTSKPVNTDQLHKVHLQVQDLKNRQASPPLQHQSDIVRQAEIIAAKATTLAELKTVITNFEGCPLKIMATNTVFSDGNPDSDIMLIGEAPGADEDRSGLPFVGTSGQLLDKMLAAIGLTRQNDYYISNIIPWRPPGNRPPTPEETAICLPFIKRHIELKRPKYLICVGGTAAKSLLNTKDPMGKLRGKWFDFSPQSFHHGDPNHGDSVETPTNTIIDASSEHQNADQSGFAIPTAVLFHPAYLLRSPGQKRLAWQDLQKIQTYFLTAG